jgi:hypothetical protein
LTQPGNSEINMARCAESRVNQSFLLGLSPLEAGKLFQYEC